MKTQRLWPVAALSIVLGILVGPPAFAQSSGKVANPSAFPAPGAYEHANAVTLLSATPGARIYYTVDGSDPSTTSTLFDPGKALIQIQAEGQNDRGEGPLTATHTIRAIATKDGMTASDVSILQYTISRRAKTAYASREVHPGIWQIRDYANDKFYVIKGSRKTLLIDTGMGTGDVRKYISDVAGGPPTDVILTHLHGDHIGQCEQFIADSNEYVHDLDRAAVVKKLKSSNVSDDVISRHLLSVKDGDVFDIGDRKLVVYHVPGHTQGSLVVFDEKNGTVFSGDSFGSNNPYVPDSAWMHLPTSLPPDVILSACEVVRAKIRGRVKEVYTGHNDGPTHELYLNRLQEALQSYVDKGDAALIPAIRPPTVWQIVLGDRLTDPEWISVNVNKNSLSAPPDKMATLSNLELSAGNLNSRFEPATLAYTAATDKATATLKITATATSTRHKSIRINGSEVKSGAAYTAKLSSGESKFEIVVTAPDGVTTKAYSLTVTR